MYNNILIPVVLAPEHAADAALAVAKRLANTNAKVTLLHVIEELPGYATSYVAADFILRSRQETLSRLKEIAGDHKGVEAEVVTGHSARTILSYAEENKSDCIIVSSHKPGVQDYFLGGTAARVVRYAKCAVHVIR